MQYLEMSSGSKEKLAPQSTSGLYRFCPERLQVEKQGLSELLLQQPVGKWFGGIPGECCRGLWLDRTIDGGSR